MASVSRRDIAQAVSGKIGVPPRQAENVINAALEAIGDELAKGNRISLTGWLTIGFGVRSAIKKGTMVRNPSTGEEQPHAGKPASLRIKVTAGKKLKDRVPGPTTKLGKALVAGKGKLA